MDVDEVLEIHVLLLAPRWNALAKDIQLVSF